MNVHCENEYLQFAVYYLPVWFQAIKGDSAADSGIHILPQVVALVIASIIIGVLTTRVGYYTPFLIVSTCITAIGSGLLSTLQVNTGTGKWIGYQIVYGWGFGGCLQAPNLAAQTVLPPHEVSIGASLMLFATTLFGAIFVSIGQNVFDGQLAKRLASITNITPQQIEDAGVTGLLKIIPAEDYDEALEAYNASLRVCFRVALIVACLCILGGLGMEWRSVKVDAKPPTTDPENAEANGDEKKHRDSTDQEQKELPVAH